MVKAPRRLDPRGIEEIETILSYERRSSGRRHQGFLSDLVRGQYEHHQRCQEELRIVIGKDAARGYGRIFPYSRLKPDDTGYTRSRNLPIQGSCADAAMLAIAYADTRLFDAEIDGGRWRGSMTNLSSRSRVAKPSARRRFRQAMIGGFAETFPGAPQRAGRRAHRRELGRSERLRGSASSPADGPGSSPGLLYRYMKFL